MSNTQTFIGRQTELVMLNKRLARVRETASGVAVAIRGRRQVGKSRLVQEFCDRAQLPYLYFTAIKGMAPTEAVDQLAEELRHSSLTAQPEEIASPRGNWPNAFRVLASALPDGPCIVVLDEAPWLAEQDTTFDGALQSAWDRLLSHKPVLLLLLGSDVHMMERLTAYDRPFFGRADNMVLSPLDPAQTGQALGLDGGDALDAHLVTGGLPGIIRSWPHSTPALTFLREECADPAGPVFSIPESALLAEFPSPDQARRVLEAVGSGDRTRANIASAAGGRQGQIASGSLSPLLDLLVNQKRVLAVDTPLSTKPGKPALYRVADSNLRLYLAMGRSAQELGRRGRPQIAAELIERRWSRWRGRAVEPMIRESLVLASSAGQTPWPETEAVGGWWNRQFDPEIDLIGADRADVAKRVHFAGSIKWLRSTFDARDMARLTSCAMRVPGFVPGETGFVVVSLNGVAPNVSGFDLSWGPQDVLAAWQTT